MKLLIIDDADAIRPRLEAALTEIDGLNVSSLAPSAGEILPEVIKRNPDVIVIDVRMPGGALDLVRTIKAGTHPPVVIALSTVSSIQYRTACHRAGAEYFFDKVREQARLVEAVTLLQKELAL